MTRGTRTWLIVLSVVVAVMLAVQVATLAIAYQRRLSDCDQLTSPGSVVFCRDNVPIL